MRQRRRPHATVQLEEAIEHTGVRRHHQHDRADDQPVAEDQIHRRQQHQREMPKNEVTTQTKQVRNIATRAMPWRLTPTMRKVALVLHVVAGIGWMDGKKRGD